MLATLRRQTLAGLASLILAAPLALAAEGYETIDPPLETAMSDQVEVLEFFWLGCPHCYSFEPTLEAWAEDKPDNVAFVREAPPLTRAWEQHSRAFYAAQVLGQEGPFVEAMFRAIHEERKPMRDPDSIADLAASLGMDRDEFLKTMRSFAVETRMKRAAQRAAGAGITGVPTIVVNGKYRTGAQLAGSYEGVIDVIEETVEKEKRSMGLE